MKINKFKINKLIIFFIIFSFFSFSLLNIRTVRASATSLPVYKYDYKNVSDYETSASNSFSSFMWYSSDGYSGNIYKNGGSYVISGEAPKQVGTKIIDTQTIHHAVYEESWAKCINGKIEADGWNAEAQDYYTKYFSMGYEQIDSGVEDWRPGIVKTNGERYLAYSCWEWAKLVKKEPIYSSDTRVWRQDYSGTLSKGYLDYILDAEITCDLQEKMVTGKNYTFHVKAKNIGDKAWKAGDNITLNKVGGSFQLQNNKLELPNDKVIIPGDSYTWTIDIKAPSPGNYDIQFQMNQLGQGNFGNITKNNVKVYDSPTNGNLEVRKYDFKESDSVYWIKSKNECKVYTEGYVSSICNDYPERNYLVFAESGKIEDVSPVQYMDINGSYYKEKSKYTDFFEFINKDKATISTNLNRNYLNSTHSFVAKKESNFKLFYNTSFMIDNEEFSSSLKDSGIWIKVDDTAPTGDVICDIDKDSNAKIEVFNISDNGGSGVKRVYVRYYTKNKVIERELNLKNGKYNDNIKLEDFFSDNDINIEILTTDNVGNSRTLFSDVYSLFSLEAQLIPNVAKQGQQIKFDIVTKGNANKLIIEFPNEIADLDNSLKNNNKISIPIDEKKYLETNYDYLLPIETPLTFNVDTRIKSKYQFVITAVKKDGRTLSCKVFLDVRDNIFDGIRTRMK